MGLRRFSGTSATNRHGATIIAVIQDLTMFGLFLRSVFFGAIHAVMYRREVLMKSGGFDERLQSSEDREFYLRLIRQASLYCHHQVIAEYRMSGQQKTSLWCAMLESDFSMQRRQWPFVRGNPGYEEAYYDGIAFLRARYGERALWQMVADVRTCKWRQVFKAFWVLLRCYPNGLLNLFKLKVRKLFLFAKKVLCERTDSKIGVLDCLVSRRCASTVFSQHSVDCPLAESKRLWSDGVSRHLDWHDRDGGGHGARMGDRAVSRCARR